MQPTRVPNAIEARSTLKVCDRSFLAMLRLVSYDNVAFLEFGLFPFAEDIADDEVLALDFLTETNAADKLAGLTLEAFAADAQLKNRKGTREVFSLKLLDGFVAELDDSEHKLVVAVDDLALVAIRDRSDCCAAALGGASIGFCDKLLNKHLELFGLLLFFCELFLGGFSFVLGRLNFVSKRSDFAVELIDLSFEFLNRVFELSLGFFKFGDLCVPIVDRHLVLTGFGLEFIELINNRLESCAHFRELGASVVEARLLLLCAAKELLEHFLLVTAASLGLIAVHYRLARHRIDDINGAELIAAVFPVVGFEVALLERGGIFFENVLHLGSDILVLDGRCVFLNFESGVFVGLALFDSLCDSDEIVLLHAVAICQFSALAVELYFKKERSAREYQKHIYEYIKGFVHIFLVCLLDYETNIGENDTQFFKKWQGDFGKIRINEF